MFIIIIIIIIYAQSTTKVIHQTNQGKDHPSSQAICGKTDERLEEELLRQPSANPSPWSVGPWSVGRNKVSPNVHNITSRKCWLRQTTTMKESVCKQPHYIQAFPTHSEAGSEAMGEEQLLQDSKSNHFVCFLVHTPYRLALLEFKFTAFSLQGVGKYTK